MCLPGTETDDIFCCPAAGGGAMTSRVNGAVRGLGAHYLAVCLLLALFMLTLMGAGSVIRVGLLGLLLCAVGVQQSSIRVDLWVLLPLVVYNLVSLVSSWFTYGNILYNYAPTQAILPVLYLLAACLEEGELRWLRRMCGLWVCAAAVLGVGEFVWRAVTSGTVRLGGLLGNPNAMGIFLVVGWFLLLDSSEESRLAALLRRGEPLVLAALALTLSMGSFLAMAAGILTLLARERRRGSWSDTLALACRLLAGASLGVGAGLLIYAAARRTDVPWTCLIPALYVLALAAYWDTFQRFLRARPRMAAVIAGGGVLVAAAAVFVRPSALATFTERLEMMRNGLGYIARHPLTGVGPYRWRVLNLEDGDKYFNTYHIHNVLIHVWAELGVLAAGALAVIVLRCLRKRAEPAQRAGFAAFCLHNLMDTSFFYLGITGLTLLTAGNPRQGGRTLGPWTVRAIFILFAALFAFNLYSARVG